MIVLFGLVDGSQWPELCRWCAPVGELAWQTAGKTDSRGVSIFSETQTAHHQQQQKQC